ncbi:hypothetical protein EZS27_043080, partial [termite gut metagenome]
HVGILFEPEIRFSFPVSYQVNGIDIAGIQTASYDNGKILWQRGLYDELLFEPADEAASEFELKDVTIGINFHWERKEDQRFLGALKIIVEEEKLTEINIIGVEDYLTSVISSEMSAMASLELLKAHAVISRSWLLKSLTPNPSPKERGEDSNSIETLIRWYDRSSHLHFDVCADDHCQRYPGITRASTKVVR